MAKWLKLRSSVWQAVKQTLPGQRGALAEHLAGRFLQRAGLTLVATNYRCRRGEIDLVMREHTHWVFVEVKYRSRQNHGRAAEQFDYHKRRRVESAAMHYLQHHGLNPACTEHRIDLVAIDGERIAWFKAV
ncbi:YraN family protein [Aestuariibacter halophilus]|uniref:UPF0102 protein LJ739_18715 n=1 Tax=Fluctibacter halophilus TaxID=226011 RepID=A0ABS8GDG9_9ALTE|nr:YraN family protein [Aestuariibacter halophilus]MCC2618296.1 YraN family protein [Aestuariibacter halophilus]